MNSLANPDTPRRRLSRGIALGLYLAVALLSSYQTYRFRPAPSEQQIAKAEDEVYEAVVRHMLPKIGGQTPGLRLVFEDQVVIDSFPPDDFRACQEDSTGPLRVANDPSPSDASFEKTDEHAVRDGRVLTPGNDVVQDYIVKRCVGGRLSRSFHTDVPSNFIGDYLATNEKILPSPTYPPYARLFPGAPGLIGFSHVGFNKHLDEAIVFRSYVCGGLCGAGTRFYLKKVGGYWQVVSSRTIWVS
jgi:hypothetical protein